MKKILYILLFLFLLFVDGGTTHAVTPEDSLIAKSERILNYFIQGKGHDLNALLRPDLRTQLPASVLDGLFNQIETQYGKLKQQGEWQKTEWGGATLYCKDLQFEKSPLQLLLGYEPNGSLNTLRVVPGKMLTPQTALSKPLYEEKDITVSTGDFHLPGKLMLPDGNGTFPVVVLVHGSGALDKDETVGSNKVFLDIANGLAKEGIATIRYDKRTFVYPKSVADFNAESVDDAVSAVRLALTLPQVDPHNIFVLGHSLGGRLLPRIALRTQGRLKGCIGLAASARPLQEVLPEQFTYLSSRVKGFAEQHPDFVKELLEKLPKSYLTDDKHYNAPAEAKKSNVSYCFLQGGKDYNVTSKDFDSWKRALPTAQFKWYPQLNHLFRVTEGEPLPESLLRKGDFSEEAIEAICRFVKTGKLN